MRDNFSNIRGRVFSVQNFNIHDGPGIRTMIFLKGCPLRCVWCSNPESQNSGAEVTLKANRCIKISKCGDCVTACPAHAIEAKDGLPKLDQHKCAGNCGRKCVESCPAGSFHLFGEEMTVEEVMARVEEEREFHSRSGGGLTISGGEPTAQPEFLLAILLAAKRRFLDTAIETSAFCQYEILDKCAPLLDTILCDLKHLDNAAHKKYTGVENTAIIDNIKRLASDYPETEMLIRTPVIPGINDSADQISAMASFIASLPNKASYELLPYHRLGVHKYASLGRSYPLGEVKLSPSKVASLTRLAKDILGERLLNEI